MGNKLKLLFRSKIFFFKYCIIGVLSISVELLLRKLFLEFNFSFFISSFLSLMSGIIFAFFANVKFNFNIPRYYYSKSLFYFVIISLSSFSLQFLLAKSLIIENLNYEFTRYLMSAFVFIIAYNFHIKFSFKKNKKVGVAIYLDQSENVNDIFSKVGYHPDYIHIDMVDNSMNEDVKDIDFNKIEEIKKFWPNHKIESHIMSQTPTKYIEKLSKYSDIIYFHYENLEDNTQIIDKIKKNSTDFGLVLHASRKYNYLEKIIKGYKEILILCIEKPGSSGQTFLEESLYLINSINKLSNRANINLCIDGGISSNNIINIDCDKIVSASNVFNSLNPKKQIINLQNLLNN